METFGGNLQGAKQVESTTTLYPPTDCISAISNSISIHGSRLEVQEILGIIPMKSSENMPNGCLLWLEITDVGLIVHGNFNYVRTDLEDSEHASTLT